MRAPRARSTSALVVAVAVVAAACTAPIGIDRVTARDVHRSLTRNVLSADELSGPTRNVLHEHDLTARFAEAPGVALSELHTVVVDGRGGPDEIYALAELSFLHAERTSSEEGTSRRGNFLAAAVYAYAFLFPDDASGVPSAFDPRFRVACDLYNRGLTAGFASADGKEVELASGTYPLPFGELDVTLEDGGLLWGDRRLAHFVPVAELEVHGFRNRYRWPGLGAPLAASTLPRTEQPEPSGDLVAPKVKVPVTALLRLDAPLRQLGSGRIRGSLGVYAASAATSVAIDGQRVPLEVEPTASLAYMLDEVAPWKRELVGFLQRVGTIRERGRLVSLAPYRSGRIPVVFVHGTASSAARWAEMVNQLSDDPVIRDRFTFWFFSYDTGSPIVYSSMLLRDSLRNAVARLDPEQRDHALEKMVVIGHSQGGLLTKMTAVDSGSEFWDHVSRWRIQDLVLSETTREMVRRALFVTPLPFVRRLVFIATPQRGSYVAGSRIAHWVARLVNMPLDVVHTATELVTLNREVLFTPRSLIATSVDNMTPGNSFIRTLARLPIADDVRAHSIIAVKGDGPIEDGSDGVVEYASAHVADVDSEFVVQSGHSCQANPRVIEEVRRILLLHAATP